MTELEIGPLAEGDAAAVVALWQQCDLLRPWNDPARDIAFCTASANAELLVGRRPGERRLVATAMVGHDGHRGWLYYVVVAPDLQGGGLGRAMVDHAETWLARAGVPKVQLMIRAENTRVCQFYQGLGYQTEPRIIMSRWLAGKAPG